MEKPKTTTLTNILDYCDAQRYISEKLGFEVGMAHEGFPEQGKYLNFWHYMIEMYIPDNVKNGTIWNDYTFSFEEMHQTTLNDFGDKDWRTIIMKKFAEEFPDPQRSDPNYPDSDMIDERGYYLLFSW